MGSPTADQFDTSLLSFCRWDFIREGNHTYKDMDRLVAYEKGLKTWAKWVEDNVNPNKTRVFFQGVSPDHLKFVPLTSTK